MFQNSRRLLKEILNSKTSLMKLSVNWRKKGMLLWKDGLPVGLPMTMLIFGL